VSSVLTAPFAAAALVLCVAGVAKVRSPAGAVRALEVAGVPGGSAALVCAFAVLEVALGAASIAAPSALTAGLLACVYGGFAALSLRLARRRAACGCFGGDDVPASAWQSALSGVLAVVGVAAALAPPAGLGWLLGRSPGYAIVFAAGVAGCAYGAVVAYTEIPRAWGAWVQQ
jgi:hypothetical protein